MSHFRHRGVVCWHFEKCRFKEAGICLFLHHPNMHVDKYRQMIISKINNATILYQKRIYYLQRALAEIRANEYPPSPSSDDMSSSISNEYHVIDTPGASYLEVKKNKRL